jgi:NADH-quinone oxidoreductase subunit F
MEKILHRILEGHGKQSDVDLLFDIQSKIDGKTICPLGEAAAWPVASAIRHFRKEFEEYVNHPEKIKEVSQYNNVRNLQTA